jgi:uncharacterized protein
MVTRRTKPSPPQPAPPASTPLIGRVLADSGPLLALFNRNDHWHARVLQWLRVHTTTQLITTWPVATEVCALLARRIGNPAALDFLRWAQRGGLAFDRPEESSLPEVLRISERFADLPFDLADASIAEAAARLKVRHVLSVDADFDVYRGRDGRVLVNVLNKY